MRGPHRPLPPEGPAQVQQQALTGQPTSIGPDCCEQLLQTLRDERAAQARRPWWEFW